MGHLIGRGLDQATADHRTGMAEQLVDDALQQVRQPLTNAVITFFEHPLSPTSLLNLELALLTVVRLLGSHVLESVPGICSRRL